MTIFVKKRLNLSSSADGGFMDTYFSKRWQKYHYYGYKEELF